MNTKVETASHELLEDFAGHMYSFYLNDHDDLLPASTEIPEEEVHMCSEIENHIKNQLEKNIGYKLGRLCRIVARIFDNYHINAEILEASLNCPANMFVSLFTHAVKNDKLQNSKKALQELLSGDLTETPEDISNKDLAFIWGYFNEYFAGHMYDFDDHYDLLPASTEIPEEAVHVCSEFENHIKNRLEENTGYKLGKVCRIVARVFNKHHIDAKALVAFLHGPANMFISWFRHITENDEFQNFKKALQGLLSGDLTEVPEDISDKGLAFIWGYFNERDEFTRMHGA